MSNDDERSSCIEEFSSREECITLKGDCKVVSELCNFLNPFVWSNKRKSKILGMRKVDS